MTETYTNIYVEGLMTGDSFIHSDGESYEVYATEEDGDLIRIEVECLSSTEGAYELVFRYGDTVKGI